MTRVAAVPITGSAKTPNETASSPAAIAKGMPARIPALSESLRIASTLLPGASPSVGLSTMVQL